MQAVSIFSGAGGFDLGATAAGVTTIAAYELDAAARDTYEKLTGQHIQQADLTRIDPRSLPDADLFYGGPPCQEFSRAGLRRGEAGERNLWPATIQIVAAKRPSVFVFENVEGMAVLNTNKPYFQAILAEFRALGYVVDWRILEAADFGIPQTRRRIFIVGRRDGLPICWPHPTHWNKPAGLFYRRWIGWGEALRGWLAVQSPSTLTMPNWLLNLPAYRGSPPPDGMYQGNRNGSPNNRQHRPIDEPSFTMIKSTDRAVMRIKLGEIIYRVDERARAILQCLPYVEGLTGPMIGNAVPPPLVEALFSSLLTL